MIELDAVTACYPGSTEAVLDRVSLRIAPHQTLVLLGGSGAGKSTVLKTILRLMPVTAGKILLDGVDITTLDRVALRRKIGMVFQGIALFPHLTVAENIGLNLKLSGMKKAAITHRVRELLQLIGLEPSRYLERYPSMLSGGEQQRVGVARALALEPNYLLMDEPFGALDAITRGKLQEELKALRRQLNITILFVTHDILEAVNLGDAIAIMDRGRVVQTGTIRELMEKPADAVVRQLVSMPLHALETFVKDHIA